MVPCFFTFRTIFVPSGGSHVLLNKYANYWLVDFLECPIFSILNYLYWVYTYFLVWIFMAIRFCFNNFFFILEHGGLNSINKIFWKKVEFSVPVSPWAGLVIFPLDLKVMALATTSLFLFNRKEKENDGIDDVPWTMAQRLSAYRQFCFSLRAYWSSHHRKGNGNKRMFW